MVRSHSCLLSFSVVIDSYLNVTAVDLLLDLVGEDLNELFMGLLDEPLKLPRLQDLSLIHRNEVDAVALKLLRIVAMRHQEHDHGCVYFRKDG